jgi:nucleoside phosphorylase
LPPAEEAATSPTKADRRVRPERRGRGGGRDSLADTDVVLICPLVVELNSALFAFDIKPGTREDLNVAGQKIYLRQLQRPTGRDLNLAISVVTKPRNASAAIATAKLLQAIRPLPELVLMSGIGGGVKSKVRLGDIVLATSVIDMAGGRAEKNRLRRRDNHYTLKPALARQLSHLPSTVRTRGGWADSVRDGFRRHALYTNSRTPTDAFLDNAAFEFVEGAVVSVEHLVADGSLESMLDIDDRIRACDMEGSGFAQAAEECGVPWALIRSISDYGDEDKNKEWQSLAAFGAALAARRFLEWEFRTRDEMEQTDF